MSNLFIVSHSMFQAFEVNTSMKMRDVEYEARRLLNSPENIPPLFK